jgi:hypothetical protein
MKTRSQGTQSKWEMPDHARRYQLKPFWIRSQSPTQRETNEETMKPSIQQQRNRMQGKDDWRGSESNQPHMGTTLITENQILLFYLIMIVILCRVRDDSLMHRRTVKPVGMTSNLFKRYISTRMYSSSTDDDLSSRWWMVFTFMIPSSVSSS